MRATTLTDMTTRSSLLALGALCLGLLGAGAGCAKQEPATAAAPTAAAPASAAPASAAAKAPAAGPFSAQIEQKFKPGEGPRIQGTVALDPQFAAQAAGHPLMIILRSQQGQGMPIAVLRVEQPGFPVRFDLGAEHAPLQSDDTPQILQAENKLFARISISGAMTGGPDDLESAPQIVKAGGPAVTLTLDHRRGP